MKLLCALSALAVLAGCTTRAKDTEFFGLVKPPAENVLRYVTGDEPESLDPQISSGQPEGRIYMALFAGLVEYDPKTNEPLPELAERWEVNSDSSEYVFHLRRNLRWSDGRPLTAHDFVYSLRRALSPALASRSAYLAYYIKYSEGYNSGAVFVRDPKTGAFVLEQDVTPAAPASAADATPSPAATVKDAAHPETAKGETTDYDTPFHHFMHGPARLVVSGDEQERAAAAAANPKLRAALAGREFVPVKGEDIGVEAVDDQTLRITLSQSAPFFVGMLAHQLFRPVPRQAIERWGAAWTQPGHMVCSGPFALERWQPYNVIVVGRNPQYWDTTHVRLDKIYFYAINELTTRMNMYKAGDIDAVPNHTVPPAWLDVLRPRKDYMDAPEMATDYYQINTTRPPMNDVRVRKAFNMAIDKRALSEFRRVTKPLTAFTPEGIFPGYPQPKGDDFDPERARKLLAEAGYRDAAGNYDPKKFPIGEVELSYNPAESNRAVAEFVQAQWKQNLKLTVPLKAVEWKTFLDSRAKLEYKGFARTGWIGDFADPFTFLALFYTPKGDNGTGWWDPKYVRMLDEANHQLDPQKRNELMAKAEAYMLDAQPVIPLLTNATNEMKKPYVKGLYPNPQTMHAWKFVYIERDPAKWDYGVPDMSRGVGSDD
ncbi:MAG TPA: peptide ABC transporter substrate-binding protein [Pyrinomonadaceae bacterium]